MKFEILNGLEQKMRGEQREDRMNMERMNGKTEKTHVEV